MRGERRPPPAVARGPAGPAPGRPPGLRRESAGSSRPRPAALPRDPTRVACAHFPDCVGCPLVGRAYGEQLRGKEETLRSELARHAWRGSVEPERIFGSPLPFGYRNHAKLVLRRRRTKEGRNEVVLGVYRPGTHSVMPAERCRVHDRRLLPFLVGLRERIEESGVAIFDERRREGSLRYALARISVDTGAIHLTLVSVDPDPPGLRRLFERLRREEPHLEAAFLCVNPTPGNAILSPDVRRVFGPRVLVERFGRLVLESRPDAFVQANPAVATRIYADAERWLEPRAEDVVIDLFGGVGAFGLALAPRVAAVLGIESSPAAVECANGNAKRAHQRHVRYVAAPAENALALAREHGIDPAEGGRRLVVANPPRSGLSAPVRDAIARLVPARVLYLSCNPATLARDLEALAASGFAVRRIRPFDMLPQTPHVEVLALLEREDASVEPGVDGASGASSARGT